MANIKNFGVIGVGSDVQFGKNGAKIVQTAGTFAAKDAQGSAFVRFQIAAGSGANDAVTFQQLNDAVANAASNASADLAALELEVANAKADIVTLKGNVVTLTSDIAGVAQDLSDETNARVAADAVLSNAIADEATARGALANTVANNAADAAAADAARIADIANTNANVATLANTVAAADQALSDRIDAIEQGDLSGLTGRVESLEANSVTLFGNVATLQSDLSAETNARVAADAVLTSDLANAVAALANTDANVTAVADSVSALAANAILKDGSVAFTGDLSMGNNVIHDVAAPVLGTDAANRAWVLSQVSSLGNAFNYIGTLAGGDIGNPTTLEELPADGTNAGDYYKVTTAGYFTYNAVVSYFNINDGLVFNTTGGYDKIDNTDASVEGTAGQIVVDGNVDTGYTLSIDPAYTAARQQEVTDAANVAAAATALVANAVAAETNARVAADAVLSNAIADEATARSDADDLLDGRITALEQSTGGDLANAVAQINANVATLANTTAAADAALSNAIASTNANVTALAGNVTTLTGTVSSLQSEVDATQTGAGLGTGGAYTANAGGHYIANATSLKTADDLLDAAVYNLSQNLANLSQDEIKTSDGLNSVKVTANTVAVKLDNAVVMDFVAGANTNTNASFDYTNAGEVVLSVDGADADVDLRLVAKGAGQVIIGDTGEGFIQADDGFDLNLAGGAGANLNLAGQETHIQDLNGNDVMVFAGTGADAHFVATNAANAVTFSAAGAATDLDIVLAPKGAGTVNASNARVVGVANAVANTDAVNKGQLDTAVATAVSAAAVGAVKTVVATVSEVNGAVALGTIKGTVLNVRSVVTSAFNSGVSIVVGTAGTPNELAAASDIDETAAGVYVVDTAKDYASNTALIVTVSGAVSGTGAAKVIVEYLVG